MVEVKKGARNGWWGHKPAGFLLFFYYLKKAPGDPWEDVIETNKNQNTHHDAEY